MYQKMNDTKTKDINRLEKIVYVSSSSWHFNLSTNYCNSPGGPVTPGKPNGPGTPTAPSGPVPPAAPGFPGAPCCPERPGRPWGPVAPTGPGVPAGPGKPTNRWYNHKHIADAQFKTRQQNAGEPRSYVLFGILKCLKFVIFGWFDHNQVVVLHLCTQFPVTLVLKFMMLSFRGQKVEDQWQVISLSCMSVCVILAQKLLLQYWFPSEIPLHSLPFRPTCTCPIAIWDKFRSKSI